MKTVTKNTKMALFSIMSVILLAALALFTVGCSPALNSVQEIAGQNPEDLPQDSYSTATLTLEGENSRNYVWKNDIADQNVLKLVWQQEENPGQNPLKMQYQLAAQIPGTTDVNFSYDLVDETGNTIKTLESLHYTFNVDERMNMSVTNSSGTVDPVPQPQFHKGNYAGGATEEN